MPSHHYQFNPRQVLRLLAGPLSILPLFALAMHLAARTGLLPAPRPTRNVDETILVHQADASRRTSQADFVFLGDSSCLMNVQTPLLSQRLRARCLNLGTFSDLDLEAAGWLLEAFAQANPGQPMTVLVLMHPEALRRASPEPHPTRLLRDYLDAKMPAPLPGFLGTTDWLLGLHDLRCRLFHRYLPVPLSGAYGRHYGFTRDLERFLTRNQGSAVDPNPKSFRGNAEYGLALSWEGASRQFRSTVPPSARLFFGITPIPQSYAPPGYEARHRQMLESWARWMAPGRALASLPSTLPDDHFVSVTHLSQAAAVEYTVRLAELLGKESDPD